MWYVTYFECDMNPLYASAEYNHSEDLYMGNHLKDYMDASGDSESPDDAALRKVFEADIMARAPVPRPTRACSQPDAAAARGTVGCYLRPISAALSAAEPIDRSNAAAIGPCSGASLVLI